MRIAICDDNQRDREEICAMVDRYGREHPEKRLESARFSGGEALLAAAGRGETFAVCLLDIVMPGLSGIELAKRLAEVGMRAPVIFLTTSREYALDAYGVRARQYLVKPFTDEALFEALDEVLADQRAARPVCIAAEDGDSLVPLHQIAYAECSVHRVRYHLKNGTVLVSRTQRIPFQETVRPLMDSGRFLQPHRSYVVNADVVLRLSGGALCLTDGTVIPVSQLRMAQVRRQYMELMLR